MINTPLYTGNVPPPLPKPKKTIVKIKKRAFKKIQLENSRLREQNDRLKRCLDLLLKDKDVSRNHICRSYGYVETIFGFNLEDLFKDI